MGRHRLYLAQDMGIWRALVNVVMKHDFIKRGESLE